MERGFAGRWVASCRFLKCGIITLGGIKLEQSHIGTFSNAIIPVVVWFVVMPLFAQDALGYHLLRLEFRCGGNIGSYSLSLQSRLRYRRSHIHGGRSRVLKLVIRRTRLAFSTPKGRKSELSSSWFSLKAAAVPNIFSEFIDYPTGSLAVISCYATGTFQRVE